MVMESVFLKVSEEDRKAQEEAQKEAEKKQWKKRPSPALEALR